jgi:hypothetical protein
VSEHFCELERYLALLRQIDSIGLDIIDRLYSAESDALRIAVAIITLDGDLLGLVIQGSAKGAGNDAGFAADAFILVDGDPLIFFVHVAGLGWTDLHAERLLTALAGHGKVAPHLLPFDYLDPGAAGIAGTRVKNRTHHFTLPAPGAFSMIDDNQFAVHGSLPL